MWSDMNLHPQLASQESFRTNWNPDDRRAPWALDQQARLLDMLPEVDLVAGPVRRYVGDPRLHSWASTGNATLLRLIGGQPAPRALVLADFGRFRGGRFAVANPPHNAPMFRARLLARAGGGFDSALDPLSDWALWVRALVNGSVMHFLGSPVAIWTKSESQYSVRLAGRREAAVEATLREHCGAWRAALGPAVCGAGVVSRGDGENETMARKAGVMQ